jgi:hypothetical protein
LKDSTDGSESAAERKDASTEAPTISTETDDESIEGKSASTDV